MIEQGSMLRGVKILDISNALAGPSASMFMAELGADVTKIENPRTNGDISRQWRHPSEKRNQVSSYWSSANIGKKILYLDLEKESKAILALAMQSDVIISNVSQRTMAKYGLHYRDLVKICPRLIYVQLVAYSNQSEAKALDLIIQAETGSMYLNADSGGKNGRKYPVALVDIHASHQIKESLLLALYRKERFGHGSYIEVSLYKSAMAAWANQSALALNYDIDPEPTGSQHPTIAPYGEIYHSKDQIPFVLAIGSDEHFAKLKEMIEKMGHTVNESYTLNVNRVKNRSSLNEMLNNFFHLFEWSILEAKFSSYALLFSKIMTLKEALSTHLSKEMILRSKDELGNEILAMSTIAFKFNS